MDAVFEEEQSHLTEVHAKLRSIEQEVSSELEAGLAQALKDKEDLFDEITRDFSSDIQVESLAELESINRIIEGHNLTADLNTEKLRRAQLLLRRPYFAKIQLKFPKLSEPKDIYIGAAGMADENGRQFIIDWRSPVAEVYYNQANGATSYEANGRTIDVDLLLRRQFTIDRDQLHAYFDTTVAIEDPLLLASLTKHRTDRLSAITMTIQKEQNEVIRHADVPALLVHGIAGSGKTSVLLQRIAYLFYTERDNLKPSDVYLMTPNPVFSRYIDNVLPDMGESNPHILTWDALMEKLGLEGRGVAKGGTLETFELIDANIEGLELEPNDYREVRVDAERVITASSVRASMEKYSYLPMGTRRCTLAIEDMQDKLRQRIMRLSKDEDVQDQLAELPIREQIDLFGQQITPLGDEDAVERTREWLEIRYAPAFEALETGEWLRLDRIGMRLTGKETLDASEWLYLRLALVGGSKRHARYVMVDEVQDYTLPQLAVLARYFNNAHFLLLGDENQAIREGTATFKQVRELFQKTHGQVDECSLMISYRSSPEITSLFCKLLPPDEQIEATSVRRPGTEANIIECSSESEYEQALRTAVDEAASRSGLSALIANSRTRAKQLAKLLEGTAVKAVADNGDLPSSGIVLLDVRLAKGLEFDNVIIPDVHEGAFPDEAVRRHRLYTAISRATENVTLISNGQLTPLLK